jgi:hypothetical protein
MDDHAQLVERLGTVLREQGVSKLREQHIEKFALQVERSQRRQRWWHRQLARPDQLRAMDILRWTTAAKGAGDLDEAIWRGFLAAHFGRPSVESPNDTQRIDSAGRLLCGFGNKPVWTWDAVSSALPVFETWLQEHSKQLADLRFGNHRKFESKKPDRLFAVIEGFVRWVEQPGGTPQSAFRTTGATSLEAAFDTLYHRMKGIHRFGRTGRFDLLLLLSDLGLLTARPGSSYLEGATGPIQGARLLWGDLPTADLEQRADELAQRVPLSPEIVEDALCMWQKKPRKGR